MGIRVKQKDQGGDNQKSPPFLQCALRRTFLTGESPKSALVVGRIQLNTKGVLFTETL